MKRLLLSLSLMAMVLCGCQASPKVTPESLLQDAQAACNKLESLTMDMEMDFDLDMGSEGFTFPLEMDVDFEYDVVMQPLQAKMDIGVEMSMLGQNEKQAMEMYFVTEGDNIKAAVYDGESWDVTEMANDGNLDSLKEPFSEDFTKLFDMTTLSLEETDVTVDQKAVYLLKGKINSDLFNNITNMAGQEEVPFDFKGQMINCEFYIYKDSKLPARVVLDMDSLMKDLMKQAFDQGLEENVTIDIKECSFTIDYKNLNEIKKVEIPSEALADL